MPNRFIYFFFSEGDQDEIVKCLQSDVSYSGTLQNTQRYNTHFVCEIGMTNIRCVTIVVRILDVTPTVLPNIYFTGLIKR